MSEEPSYLERLHLNIKKKINKHMDNIHNRIRFNTDPSNVNVNYLDPSNNLTQQQPRIVSQDEKKPHILFFKKVARLLLRLLLLLLIGASILYLANHPEVLDKYFPDKCDEYPFGYKQSNPCAKPFSIWNYLGGNNGQIGGADDVDVTAIKDIAKKSVGAKSASSVNKSAIDELAKTNVKSVGKRGQDLIDKLLFGDVSKKKDGHRIPAFPYKYFDNNTTSVSGDYFNWFIKALAETNTNANSFMKGLIQMLADLPQIVILFLGIISFIMIPIILLYTLFGNIFYQGYGFFSRRWETMLLIILTTILTFIPHVDFLIAIIISITVFLKILLYPYLTDFSKVLSGLKDQQENIGYLISFILIYSAWTTPMNKTFSLVRTIVTIFYIMLLIISVGLRLKNTL